MVHSLFTIVMNDVELIEQVKVSSATTHIQPPDFSKTKDKELLVSLVVLRSVVTSYLDLFLASTRSFDLLHYLIVLDLHCKYAYREIVNRINKLPDWSVSKLAGNLRLEGKSEVDGQPLTEDEIFLAILGNIRHSFMNPGKKLKYIPTYDWAHEEKGDLITVAKIAAWGCWQGIHTAIDKEMEPVFASHPFLSMEARALVSTFLPILRGDLEKLTDRVRQAHKNHFEKRKTQKKH